MHPIDSTTYRSTAFNQRKDDVRFLVLHYTAAPFNASVNALAKGSAVSAHYLVPDPAESSYLKAGFDAMRVFQLVDERERAWHAGVSAWAGSSGLNDSAIGIEVVNLASFNNGRFVFPSYHPQQLEALVPLCQAILQRYPAITPTHVLGHSDVSIGRKSDPGAAFPWQALHQAGVGAWYDQACMQHYQSQFTQRMPAQGEVLERLRRYGYSVPADPDASFVRALLRAFQLHFRPAEYSGRLDSETAAILYALVDRYAG